MEQFKICEKDTKTKAYSKEGLAREARTDPKEIEREEKRCWLNDCLERLGDLIDSIEVDVEKMTSVKGGKTKMKDQVQSNCKKKCPSIQSHRANEYALNLRHSWKSWILAFRRSDGTWLD